jgi:uncharacterized membrane protein (UPF0127 family)
LASFLSPILAAPEQRFALCDDRSRAAIATRLETAFDSTARRRGLLGRTSFEAGAALIIAPCNAIHTCFMRIVIDVVFASRNGLVLKTYSRLPAWRIAFSRGGFAAIELPAGTVEAGDIGEGDRLVLIPSGSDGRG